MKNSEHKFEKQLDQIEKERKHKEKLLQTRFKKI